MKKVIRFFVYGALYYYVWLGLHTLLFDFEAPVWVVLCVLFLSFTLADEVVRQQEEIESEIKKDDD